MFVSSKREVRPTAYQSIWACNFLRGRRGNIVVPSSLVVSWALRNGRRIGRRSFGSDLVLRREEKRKSFIRSRRDTWQPEVGLGGRSLCNFSDRLMNFKLFTGHTHTIQIPLAT